MSATKWAGAASRKLTTRVVVEGDLVLQTPAHLGNGDGDELADMPLLVDPLDGRTPLLTGASIAGAMRSYLRAVERGYEHGLSRSDDRKAIEQERGSATARLFGGFRGDDEGEQSPLVVEDALGRDFAIELRDGVRIDPRSRTATEDALFNLQLWQAGTTFPLRFELAIRDNDSNDEGLTRALATALQGFNDDGITLGARKRRGYGRVRVSAWRAQTFDLRTPNGLLGWLGLGASLPDSLQAHKEPAVAMGDVRTLDDRRREFRLTATFALESSLLIRSGGGQDDRGPDMVHLHAGQPGGKKAPILSGTSLAGALRARALRIASTLGATNAPSLVENLFGREMKVNQAVDPHASKLSVSESVLRNVRTDLVQNRVSIDRFTGGACETALFNQLPAFAGPESEITVELRVVNPEDHELGLVLLLLKDLWTGDLPLGGESSVGRGRLSGREAELTRKAEGRTETWRVLGTPAGLRVDGDQAQLNSWVQGFNREVKEVRP